jgi:hypothetical protein
MNWGITMDKHFISLLDFYNLTLRVSTPALEVEFDLNRLNIYVDHNSLEDKLNGKT